jgi:tetratricopeptide (TPR) repeat protein
VTSAPAACAASCGEDRLARFLRGAAAVVAAALVLILPQLATRTTFDGDSESLDPVAALAVGLAFWMMPALLIASWAAAGRVRLAQRGMLLSVGLLLVGAGISTALASDKASAVVRAVEMGGAWAAFFALLEVLRGGADRRFLLGAVVATGGVSAAVALAQHAPERPEVFAATVLVALPVVLALAAEKWRRLRTWGVAVVLVAVAIGLAAALVLQGGAWLRAEEPATWRAAAAMILDRGLTGVGLENFGWHYAAYEPVAFGGAPVRAGNVWLAVGGELGLAGLAGAVLLGVVAVRGWRRPSPAVAGEERGAGLLVRLFSAALLAAPALLVLFPLGARIGAGALAAAVVVTGLASADSPWRLRLSDRALGPVRWGCIAGVVAWWLYAQAAPIFFEASSAWPMLVVLAASLERQDEGDLPSAAGVRLDPRLQFLVMIAVMAGCFGYVKWLLVPTVHERAWLEAASKSETAYDEAEALRKAASANPLAWEPLVLEGFLWRAEAKQEGHGPSLLATEKAIRAFTEAAERHPRLWAAHLELAACRLAVPGALEDRSALEAARGNLERAAELTPYDAETQVDLGDVAYHLGDEAAALKAYRRALVLEARAPEGARCLTEERRRGVERRVAELEESLEPAAPAP